MIFWDLKRLILSTGKVDNVLQDSGELGCLSMTCPLHYSTGCTSSSSPFSCRLQCSQGGDLNGGAPASSCTTTINRSRRLTPKGNTRTLDSTAPSAEGDGDSDTAVPGDDEPIVKMTQILASINTLGLEMNKQVNFKKLLSRSAISRRNIQMRLMHKPRSA